MNHQLTIARHLLEIKAVQLNPKAPFTWASGIQSPIYCDNRKILSYPHVRNVIKTALVEQANQLAPFDVVAGVATAGIAYGALLADALQKPFIYVRSKAKGHGLQNRIEGHLERGQDILVVEDLISTGGSSLQAVDALREAACRVVGVLAIFTYGFARARQAFADAQCPMITLTNYDSLLSEALGRSYIDADEATQLRDWREQFL